MNQDDQNQTFTSIAELEILATIGELVAKHGSEAFTKIVNEAAYNRKSPFFIALAKNCQTFLKAYENLNYHPESNGECFILQVLSKLFSQETEVCIFDVGANIGEWTLMANQIFPTAKIHAFEIAHPTFKILKSKTQAFSNIVANDYGLSDKIEEVQLRYFPNASTLTTITEYPHNLDCVTIKGSVVNGDSYIQAHKIEHIHFVKIDVEGAEHLVLNGLLQAISNKQIDVIQFEYGQVNIITKALLIDFYQFFYGQGYKIGKIYPNYVEFTDYGFTQENFLGPNYLAIRQERHDWIDALS